MYEQLYLKFSYFISFFYLYKLPFYTWEKEWTKDGYGACGGHSVSEEPTWHSSMMDGSIHPSMIHPMMDSKTLRIVPFYLYNLREYFHASSCWKIQSVTEWVNTLNH